MNLNRVIFCLLFIGFSINLLAQVPTEQDCLGAIPVCQDEYYQEDAYTGSGNFPGELNTFGPTCMIGGEENSVWYVFTVENDGMLSFILTPENLNDDYDWGLYNLTDASCEDIFDDPSLEVQCNSYGVIGVNGPTGISTAEGGTGSSNGPGNLNGPAFNADFEVFEGEVFVLLVQDWSGSDDGYTLDFSVSTADIFDALSPEIISASWSCDQTLEIQFSENVTCESLGILDFQITGTDGTVYSPTDMSSPCDDDLLITNTVTLEFDLEITSPTGNDFTVSVVDSDGNVEDLCGNIVLIPDFDFPTPEPIESNPVITPSTCNENNGVIDLTDTSNGFGPYSFDLNGDDQVNPVFENLPAGAYSLIVTDDAGCILEMDLEIEEISTIDVNAGEDDFSCSLTYNLSGIISEVFPIEWSGDDVSFSDDNNLNSMVTADSPGTYEITLSLDQDGCIITDEVEITFSDVDFDLALVDNECGDNCTGEAIADAAGGVTPYEYSWFGEDPISEETAQLLCAGTYSIEVIDQNGCSESTEFVITQPVQPEIESIDVVGETCAGYCDGSIVVNASNASNYSIETPVNFVADSVFQGLCKGQYVVKIVSETGCYDEESVFVNAHYPPEADFTVAPTSALIDNPLFYFQNQTEGNNSLWWQIGYPDAIFNSDENEFEYIFEDATPGNYRVQLLIIDSEGCVSTKVVYIEILSSFYLYAPNAFTPNGDGLNEFFKPIIEGHDENYYDLHIFNRNGESVFHSKDPNEVWLGETRGGEYFSDTEVYNYRLVVKPMFEVEEKLFTGFITLIR